MTPSRVGPKPARSRSETGVRILIEYPRKLSDLGNNLIRTRDALLEARDSELEAAHRAKPRWGSRWWLRLTARDNEPEATPREMSRTRILFLRYKHQLLQIKHLLPAAGDLGQDVSQRIEHGALDELERIELRLRLAEFEQAARLPEMALSLELPIKEVIFFGGHDNLPVVASGTMWHSSKQGSLSWVGKVRVSSPTGAQVVLPPLGTHCFLGFPDETAEILVEKITKPDLLFFTGLGSFPDMY